jgi:hypothetical protein
MGEKIFKLTIGLAVLVAIVYVVGQFNGGGAKGKQGKPGANYWRRRWSGERWQPAGVVGPMAQGQTTIAVPLAPIYPA